MAKKSVVPLKELNLTDRFLFDEVMEDPQIHQEVLSLILGREISLLQESKTEKEGRISPLIRSIRMDLFAIDSEEQVYNTEIQEVPQCKLQDGTVRIFLNTKGKNDDEVPKELIEFLHYIENTTDEVAQQSKSKKIRHIHERVCEVKRSEEIGVKYMQAWEEKYYEQQEAREEGIKLGIEEGIQTGERRKLRELAIKKQQKGKSIEEIAEILEEDEETIRQLLEEQA